MPSGESPYRVMGEFGGSVLSVLSVRGTGSPSALLMTGNASETNRWPPVTALVMTASLPACFFEDTSRCSQGSSTVPRRKSKERISFEKGTS